MKTTCEFHFGFWDVTARSDAQLNATNYQPWSNANDILDDEIEIMNIATLEPDFGWPLDGTKSLLPNDPSDNTWGWWSEEMSGENGSFPTPPQLVISFADDSDEPTPHSSVGITLEFQATLPQSVNIKWYGAEDELLSDKDFMPDDYSFFCENSVENYYKLIITIPSMQETQRYLRVTKIIFGALEYFYDNRIVQATLTEEVDPAALTLPISTLQLSFYSPDGQFDLLNPQGAYTMFQFKQEISVYRSIDGNRSYMGKYYLQEASGTVDAITQLTCMDVIGLLDTIEYKGGIYTNTPVNELLSDILGPEDIDYVLDSKLQNITISGYLPIDSKRTALQQIAIAIGAIINPTRNGAIQITAMPDAKLSTISVLPSQKIIGHKITLEELITQVDVTAHEYVPGEDESLKEIAKTNLPQGTHTITFSSPSEVSSVRGASLIVSHPNYCVVTLDSAGEVTVQGYPFSESTTVYTVLTDPLPAGAKTGTKSITAATLIDPAKAESVANRIYNYYQLRYKDEGQILPGNESVAMVAEISSMASGKLTGYIQRIVTDLAGGSLETITLRGS